MSPVIMNNKICFIYCVNNTALFNESLKYINSLNIPSGMEIEIISIDNASSMAAGYNKAMKASNAKYKVYLHQDVFILNENFIYDIISLFQKNINAGMIGIVGSKNLPSNGIWWESEKIYGKVYDSHTGKMTLLSFNENEKTFEEVQAIDGLIMVTQYDLPWKEEIITGWHFYDISQSFEFAVNGLNVIVPKQTSPWVMHDCGFVDMSEYEKYREIFLDNYKGQLKV